MREETDLRLGIEADFVVGREDRMANLLEGYEWDYVVGRCTSSARAPSTTTDYDVWDSARDPDQVWRRYFEILGEAARSGMFDILAHPDLVKMWGGSGPQPDGDLRRYYDLAMEGIAESRHRGRGVHRRAAQAGGRALPGAAVPGDGARRRHARSRCPPTPTRPTHLGAGYEQAVELLGDLGVGEIAVFEGRERRMEPIG